MNAVDAPADSAPASPLGRVARFVLGDRINWLLTFFLAIIVAFSAVFLITAWQIGPQVVTRHAEYRKLTAHADAHVVESWLALDVDVAGIKSADNWRASTLASPCIVVELAADWSGSGNDRRRGFCGNRFQFNDSYDVPFLDKLSPEVPFAWSRDARGFAVPELRLSSQANAWLSTHQVDMFMHDKWPAKNALEWLTLENNRPVDLAIAGWMAVPATLAVVYDPAHTDVMYPRALIEARMQRSPSYVFAVILGGIGLVIWCAAMWYLPLLQNFNVAGRAVLVVLPLLTLPWWADQFPAQLRRFNAPMAMVLGDMIRDIDPLDRFAATAPDEALLAEGVRVIFRAGDAPYADTFGQLRFGAPPAHPVDGDAALRELVARATPQIVAMPLDEQVAFFNRVRRDKLLDLKAAGVIAVAAARQATMDAQTDPAVRHAAIAFLQEWTTSPSETGDPHLPAYAARGELWKILSDVPVPTIANMVR